MISKNKFYDAIGELIYAMNTAAPPKAIEALKKTVDGHDWADEIQWSFKYELNKQKNRMDVYRQAFDTFKSHGPDREYKYLIEMLNDFEYYTGTIGRHQTDSIKNQFINDLEIFKLKV